MAASKKKAVTGTVAKAAVEEPSAPVESEPISEGVARGELRRELKRRVKHASFKDGVFNLDLTRLPWVSA